MKIISIGEVLCLQATCTLVFTFTCLFKSIAIVLSLLTSIAVCPRPLLNMMVLRIPWKGFCFFPHFSKILGTGRGYWESNEALRWRKAEEGG